jgi:hypothetical protein
MYSSFQHVLRYRFQEDIYEEHKKKLEPFQQYLQQWRQNLQNYKKHMIQSPIPSSSTSSQLLSILNTPPSIHPTTTTHTLYQQFEQKKTQFQQTMLEMMSTMSYETFTMETIQKWNKIQQTIYTYFYQQFHLFLKVQDNIQNYMITLKKWEEWMSQSPIPITNNDMEQYRHTYLLDHWLKQFSIQDIQDLLHTYFTMYEYIQPYFQMYFTIPLQTCSVCCNDPKECVYIPCGHTFCKSCSEKWKQECPVCRTNVQSIQPMFL